MTARDHFKIKWKCLKCDKVGEAEASQEDGYSFVFGDQSTRIEKAPEGFDITEEKDNFYNLCARCQTCGERAALLTP